MEVTTEGLRARTRLVSTEEKRSLLLGAASIVREREQKYGPPDEHWGKAAAIANILFDLNLDAATWGKLWIVDKLVRDGHLPGRDHLTDICGYADGIDRIRGRA